MEVKFRIEEKVKETHGGQDLYPHEWSYPVGELNFVLEKFNYSHTWHYEPPTLRV